MAALGPLTEGQLELFFLVHSFLQKPAPVGAPRLVDHEVADAATAVAATLETASRGVIFEHSATTPNGQRLAADLRTLLGEAGKGGGSRFEREAAVVLRAIARAAAEPVGKSLDARSYLDLVSRILREGSPEAPADDPSPIILP
ncbi:MAG: hypothetical protein AB7U83_19350 [Vicinamibacterales bacterium]